MRRRIYTRKKKNAVSEFMFAECVSCVKIKYLIKDLVI